jgi:deoxyadenosine/deoxycytidine kinase
MPFFIATVGGGIGAGKSSLLRKIKERYANNPHVTVIEEPVESWKWILAKMYEDPKKYGFIFQAFVCAHYIDTADRIKRIRDEYANREETALVIMERSLFDAFNVFCVINASTYTDQQNVTLKEFYMESVEKTLHGDFTYFYIECPPTVCMERIEHRSRFGENRISMDYLVSLDEAYESALSEHRDNFKKIIRLRNDAGSTLDSVFETIVSHLPY